MCIILYITVAYVLILILKNYENLFMQDILYSCGKLLIYGDILLALYEKMSTEP